MIKSYYPKSAMIGRKLFSPVSFIRLRMVALAPLFLVCRWRYTPYPAQQQKNIKEKTKLNTIPLIWFTFCSRHFWNSTTFRRPGRDSQILFPQIWIGTLWMSPNLEAGVRNSVTCILSKKTEGFLTVLRIRDILVRIRIHDIRTSD